MPVQATTTAIGSDKVVEKLLHRVSKDQLAKLVDSAAASSGRAVGNAMFEPGDELCPNFHFPFPFPPRFDDFLNQAATLGKLRLFPYGILNPEGVFVQVSIAKMQQF